VMLYFLTLILPPLTLFCLVTSYYLYRRTP
jgi:hypothetical protein